MLAPKRVHRHSKHEPTAKTVDAMKRGAAGSEKSLPITSYFATRINREVIVSHESDSSTSTSGTLREIDATLDNEHSDTPPSSLTTVPVNDDESRSECALQP